jgi:hypothetical protein
MASKRKPLRCLIESVAMCGREILHHVVYRSGQDRKTASNRISAACSPEQRKRALCLAFENCPAAFWISLPISLAHE